MKKFLWAAMSVAACGVAVAKLPPLDDAAKAKAAEAAAKSAWQAKVDGYQLCKAQDKVAAAYVKSSGKAAPALTDNKGAPMKAGAATAAASAPVAAASARATAAAMPGAVAPAAAVVAAAPAAAASGTPVASAAVIPPCLEPGPFAYNPPEQKPLETAGAHSPTGTAASPPSVKANSAQMAPAKK
ncbi:hypothetical protein [Caenimonas sp. SL110]|uniref:hypothetical protein n=1 Tax=Caenimonas sp. SL110 TaxID=1450524 RepID=UPI0006543114|nr:hypothetical protein [Caenimonas sp. SL110]